MLEKCQECYGFVGSSCICALADAISDTLSSLGVTEYYISDIKYDYDSPHCVENVVVCEDMDLKQWFSKVVDTPL